MRFLHYAFEISHSLDRVASQSLRVQPLYALDQGVYNGRPLPSSADAIMTTENAPGARPLRDTSIHVY